MTHKQRFLLSAKARMLSVRQVFELTEQQAFETFREVRWGGGEAVTCPTCGTIGKHYFIRVRRQWRCNEWRRGLQRGRRCPAGRRRGRRARGRGEEIA